MLLITIMTFLSAVTLGGVVLVQKSAIAWSADVGREVTIQIRPVEGEVMDSNLRTAVALAETTPGVSAARALTIEESQALLEPWLGTGLDFSHRDSAAGGGAIGRSGQADIDRLRAQSRGDQGREP